MKEADGSSGKHPTGDAAKSPADKKADAAPRGPGLHSEVQGKLGEKLKEVYSDVMNEPVPDRFLDLLAQLDAKGAKSGGDAE